MVALLSATVEKEGTLDVASRVPRDEGRSCRCRPCEVSYYPYLVRNRLIVSSNCIFYVELLRNVLSFLRASRLVILWKIATQNFQGSSIDHVPGPHPFQTQSTITLVRGLLGTDPPGPTLESASPSPPQGSIWHRFSIDSTSIRRFDPISMLNRCQIEP